MPPNIAFYFQLEMDDGNLSVIYKNYVKAKRIVCGIVSGTIKERVNYLKPFMSCNF